MAEENNINDAAKSQEPGTSENQDSMENNGRMFSQNEVNAIIRDRLARERAKTPADEREQALSARESKLDCREYITEKQYPSSLLDVFNTDDLEAFKTSVEKLTKAFPAFFEKQTDSGTGGSVGAYRRKLSFDDSIAAAFKP